MGVITWRKYLEKRASDYRHWIERDNYEEAAGVIATTMVAARDQERPVLQAIEFIITPPAGGPSPEAIEVALEKLKAELSNPALSELIDTN